MVNTNHYGHARILSVVELYAKQQEEKELAKKLEKLAITSPNHEREVASQQNALKFDYSKLPQHSALRVEKNGGIAKLFIKIDIVHPYITAKEPNFLRILPKYAQLIKNIEVVLIAPTYHPSEEIYNLRIENMMKTIDVLNNFQIENLEFVVSCNRPDNFNQMKLAAACFGLKFSRWTMKTAIFGDKTKGIDVGVNSRLARRLFGVYKHDFLKEKSF